MEDRIVLHRLRRNLVEYISIHKISINYDICDMMNTQDVLAVVYHDERWTLTMCLRLCPALKTGPLALITTQRTLSMSSVTARCSEPIIASDSEFLVKCGVFYYVLVDTKDSQIVKRSKAYVYATINCVRAFPARTTMALFIVKTTMAWSSYHEQLLS